MLLRHLTRLPFCIVTLLSDARLCFLPSSEQSLFPPCTCQQRFPEHLLYARLWEELWRPSDVRTAVTVLPLKEPASRPVLLKTLPIHAPLRQWLPEDCLSPLYLSVPTENYSAWLVGWTQPISLNEYSNVWLDSSPGYYKRHSLLYISHKQPPFYCLGPGDEE